MANKSNFTTCISLNNQSCMTRPTHIDLNPDDYYQRLCYYPFMANLMENGKRKYNFFFLITMTNELKHQQNIYNASVNVNFMVENLIQIKSGITINANAHARI